MAITHILGYPRIGARRELKFATEAYWRGEADAHALERAGRNLRAAHWAKQEAAGLGFLAAGDFSFYDHVLDHLALFGCIPARFGFDAGRISRAGYFTLARGSVDQPALEMTKWFDTNYHYLVPELDARTRFDRGVDWIFDHVGDALARGRPVKPVLIGPLTFLRLAKCGQAGFDRLQLLAPLVEAYGRVLERLHAMGIEWVQLDEPALCTDLETAWLDAFEAAYVRLAAGTPRILLATYFGSTAEHMTRIARLPIHGVHLDCVRAPEQWRIWSAGLPAEWILSAGVVDGRNIWRTDLRAVLSRLRAVHERLGDRLWIAPSCSLLHVPVSAREEQISNREVQPWLAFADEKLEELRILAAALNEGDRAVESELAAADAVVRHRRSHPLVVDPVVRARTAAVTPSMAARGAPFATRIRAQRARLKLPPLATTTIGSFPQTAEIRAARAAWKRGALSSAQYEAHMQAQISHAVERQEALGLDVLVHGEAERNDMVEFFGEQLQGYAFSGSGWVQSYGTRCVKPPIIFGDISRPRPMTVKEARYAQSLTAKPMKGMLTGPITLLQWSFARDDLPRRDIAVQLALAIRDEAIDLERAGIRIIQIDEPAIREGLPLRRAQWNEYLDWAQQAFRLAAAGVRDETQIHTHMCYSEFNDILPAIAGMDADVITIETSRSRMELLEAFGCFAYPNEIGPGVYDIHAPRVPSAEEMLALLKRAVEVIPAERLWVNPDCGLKTRGWPETEAALANMVAAAKRMRALLGHL